MEEYSRKEKEQLEEFIYSKYENTCILPSEAPTGTMMKQAFPFCRRWGISPMVNVNNVSGHKAWVMISPTPMTRISSIGIEKAGNVDFSMVGDYKCQQAPVLHGDVCTFTLDTTNIYYTVFFESGSWKMSHDNMKLNTSQTDIHLVERHFLAAVDSDFVPGHKTY